MPEKQHVLCSYVTAEGKLLQCNDSFSNYLGVAAQGLIGKDVQEVFTAYEAQKIVQAVKECTDSPQNSFSIDIKSSSGGVDHYFRWMVYAEQQEGKVVGVHLIGRNINAEKEAEKEFHYQAALLNNISDAVISTDKCFVVRSWNKAAEKIYNIKAADALGKSMADLVQYQFFGTDQEASMLALYQNEQWRGVVKYLHPQGNDILLDATVTPVRQGTEVIGYVAVNRDITATSGLDETLQNFYSAFAHVDEAFFFLNKEHTILYLNDCAHKLLQRAYGRDVVKGQNVLEALPGFRYEAVKEVLQTVLSGQTVEYEIEAPGGGRSCWMTCKYFPTRDIHGNISGVCAIIKDVTTQKEVELLDNERLAIEQKLYQSRQLFELFMQNSPLVAWLTDANGVMHYMNPVYLRTYGFSTQDFGRHLSELFGLETAQEYHENNLRVLAERTLLETIESAVAADGRQQVIKIYKFPIKFNGVVMVGGWAVDISEQMDLQEELLRNNERYEYVNAATSDAIYDWCFESGKIRRNEGYEKLFGFTERAVTLKTRLTLIHPEDLAKFKRTVFQALKSNQDDRWRLEYRFRDSDGNYRHVVDKAFIIRNESKVVRVIGAMQDVTEQKALQQKLVEQEKKRKREVIKSIIETQEKERRQLSVELHDNVNQMLASCKLMLEVARENRENSAMLIERSYQGIQEVINEIRKISHDLNPSALSDVGLTEAIQQMIDPINLSGRIRISFVTDRHSYRKLLKHEDEIAIFRIVQEQLNNILKHAKAGHASIALSLEQGVVKLCIEDDGVGFDMNGPKKGLGLRNIYHRVDYYNGTMDVVSSPGNGCKMNITLKVKSSAHAYPAKKA